MKRTLSVALVVALVAGATPVGAQRQFAAAASAGVSYSPGDGPLTRAAVREALRVGLGTPAELQEKPPSGEVLARRAVAREITIGEKVKVTMRTGEKHTGTLRAAGENAVTIQTTEARVVELRYDAMRSIERVTGTGRGVRALVIVIASISAAFIVGAVLGPSD